MIINILIADDCEVFNGHAGWEDVKAVKAAEKAFVNGVLYTDTQYTLEFRPSAFLARIQNIDSFIASIQKVMTQRSSDQLMNVRFVLMDDGRMEAFFDG